MPELPEVETVRRTLLPRLLHKTLVKVRVNHPQVLKNTTPGEFEEQVAGKTVTGLERRGKFLLFCLEPGLTMVVHLGMTGRLVHCPPETPLVPHTHLVFQLSDGWDLRYTDPRRFGGVRLYPTEDLGQCPSLGRLGIEPLSPEFSGWDLARKIRGRKRAVKELLLDQSIIAGLGNIYADEALFAARIHPQRRADSLSGEEIARLQQAVRAVLEKAVEHRGTSFRDYVDGTGEPGGFQTHLQVYQRTGEPCPRCGKIIDRVQIGGRSSHFCPDCQPVQGG